MTLQENEQQKGDCYFFAMVMASDFSCFVAHSNEEKNTAYICHSKFDAVMHRVKYTSMRYIV